jgi:hypothetical protein
MLTATVGCHREVVRDDVVAVGRGPVLVVVNVTDDWPLTTVVDDASPERERPGAPRCT